MTQVGLSRPTAMRLQAFAAGPSQPPEIVRLGRARLPPSRRCLPRVRVVSRWAEVRRARIISQCEVFLAVECTLAAPRERRPPDRIDGNAGTRVLPDSKASTLVCALSFHSVG